MSKHFFGGIVTALLYAAITPFYAQAADFAKKPTSSEEAKAKRDLSGEKSPEALIEKYLMSIATGKPATTASCFDQSSEDGKTSSQAMESLSRAIETYHTARRVAKQKFGEAGVAVIDSEFKIGIHPEYIDPVKMRRLLDTKTKVFREGADKAAARPFGDDIPMHLKDGRWYMTPLGTDLELAAFCAATACLSKGWTDSFAQVPDFVKQSKSPAELRQKIKKAVDDADAAVTREIKKLPKVIFEKQQRSKQESDSQKGQTHNHRLHADGQGRQ